MLCHDALIADVNACEPGEGKCAFWWLGQHGFILKLGKKVLYLDPFISDLPDRLVPPLLDPAEMRNANLVFGSHDHADHIDRKAWPGIVAAAPRREVIAAGVINALHGVMRKFAALGFVGFAEDWAGHDWLRGREITVELPDRQVSGTAVGVNPGGALLVDTGNEKIPVVSGSIIVKASQLDRW